MNGLLRYAGGVPVVSTETQEQTLNELMETESEPTRIQTEDTCLQKQTINELTETESEPTRRQTEDTCFQKQTIKPT